MDGNLERHDHEVERASTTDGLPVASALGPLLEAAQIPLRPSLVDARVMFISGLAVGLGVVSAFVAKGLIYLIDIITNLSFYGRWSAEPSSPAGHHLGA